MKTTPSLTTLTLVTLFDFALHAGEIGAKRVYLAVSSNPTDAQIVRTGEGQFVVVATARTPETILQCVKVVDGVTAIDAHVNAERVESVVAERMDEIARELEAAALVVKRGRWTIKPPFEEIEEVAQ